MSRSLTAKPYPLASVEDEPTYTLMGNDDDPFGSGTGTNTDWGFYWPGVTLHSDDDGSWIEGGGGNDTLIGGAGVDWLFGKGGHDTISGGGHIDYLFGDSGNDTLAGNADDDHLEGGTGNDRLTGGAGNDWLEGGEGADVFRFEMTEEVGLAAHIEDFHTGQDTLSIFKGHTPIKGTATNYMEVQVAAGTSDATMDALAEIYLQNPNIKHVFMTDGTDGFLFSGTAGYVDLWIQLGGLDSKADFSWTDIV